MTKDVIDAILGRRSNRRFKSENIPQATIGRILDAAIWAPSAGNIQPWHFYVVKNDEKKEMLAIAALNQRFVSKAPINIVVCAIPQKSGLKYGGRGAELYCLQDTGAAIQNILLAATGYGLATCWVGAFDEVAVKAALDMPDEFRPVAIIPLGYPDGEVTPPAKWSVDEVVTIIS